MEGEHEGGSCSKDRGKNQGASASGIYKRKQASAQRPDINVDENEGQDEGVGQG